MAATAGIGTAPPLLRLLHPPLFFRQWLSIRQRRLRCSASTQCASGINLTSSSSCFTSNRLSSSPPKSIHGGSRSYSSIRRIDCGENLGLADNDPEVDSSLLGLVGERVSNSLFSTSDVGRNDRHNLPSPHTIEELIGNADSVRGLMKMERMSEPFTAGLEATGGGFSRFLEGVVTDNWFPYLDAFRSGNVILSSSDILKALNSYIMDGRKERIRNAVKNRSYSVCLVVEGLTDFGNVSATFRSADALGFQSVHVISKAGTKRYRENRNVSKGAEKWLDIELWKSPENCFKVLKSRGYRIATTSMGENAVSIHEMDWTIPTAIVVGNEHCGISKEAMDLSDLHCSIPMMGMVDSFNVSVAAGIVMHHAVCDRISRLGYHGDLTPKEREILHAEFSLRHSKGSVDIVHEFAKRKSDQI